MSGPLNGAVAYLPTCAMVKRGWSSGHPTFNDGNPYFGIYKPLQKLGWLIFTIPYYMEMSWGFRPDRTYNDQGLWKPIGFP